MLACCICIICSLVIIWAEAGVTVAAAPASPTAAANTEAANILRSILSLLAHCGPKSEPAIHNWRDRRKRLHPHPQNVVWPGIDKHPADRTGDQAEQRDRTELPDDDHDGGVFPMVEAECCRTERGGPQR